MSGPGRAITSKASRISCDEENDGTYSCEIFDQYMSPPVSEVDGIVGVQLLDDRDLDGNVAYAHAYSQHETPEGPDVQFRFNGDVEVRWIHEEDTGTGPMLLVDT